MNERPLAELLAQQILDSEEPTVRAFAPLAREYQRMTHSQPVVITVTDEMRAALDREDPSAWRLSVIRESGPTDEVTGAAV